MQSKRKETYRSKHLDKLDTHGDDEEFENEEDGRVETEVVGHHSECSSVRMYFVSAYRQTREQVELKSYLKI